MKEIGRVELFVACKLLIRLAKWCKFARFLNLFVSFLEIQERKESEKGVKRRDIRKK
jgi:hypothetical protein